MNIFRLTVIKFCIVFFIPLKVYSQSTEIYTDLRGNKYAAINYKGMVKYKVEDRSKNTNFRSYIQLYKYDSDNKPQEEKDESGNNVFVYRTTRHTERQKEGGGDWKVSGYFLVSPDIVNKEGAAKAQTMDWASANGYLTSANSNVYSTPSFAVTKGCAAYRGKDGLDETGTWRVPTRGECALILLFYKKWRRLKKQPVFNHSLFPPKILLITGLQRRKEEILKMHGQCDYMLMIK